MDPFKVRAEWATRSRFTKTSNENVSILVHNGIMKRYLTAKETSDHLPFIKKQFDGWPKSARATVNPTSKTV
jgi:hypothetical protein